jgi:hypothetical protein
MKHAYNLRLLFAALVLAFASTGKLLAKRKTETTPLIKNTTVIAKKKSNPDLTTMSNMKTLLEFEKIVTSANIKEEGDASFTSILDFTRKATTEKPVLAKYNQVEGVFASAHVTDAEVHQLNKIIALLVKKNDQPLAARIALQTQNLLSKSSRIDDAIFFGERHARTIINSLHESKNQSRIERSIVEIDSLINENFTLLKQSTLPEDLQLKIVNAIILTIEIARQKLAATLEFKQVSRLIEFSKTHKPTVTPLLDEKISTTSTTTDQPIEFIEKTPDTDEIAQADDKEREELMLLAALDIE